MTSHELAKKLLDMPDVAVTVRGYEGGVDIIETINEAQLLHLNTNEDWYYGKHEYKPYQCEEGCNHLKTYAIHLNK